MTLNEFLLARVAEDESVARAVVDSHAMWDWESYVASAGMYDTPASEFATRHDPARVLAQCAALRRIVAAHELAPYYGLDRYGRWLPREGEPKFWYCDCESGDGMIGRDGPCETLRALATIWADHEDYRPEEWA